MRYQGHQGHQDHKGYQGWQGWLYRQVPCLTWEVNGSRGIIKSVEGSVLAIVTNFVSEIYFLMWFFENSCITGSEYVPNLPPTMYFFRATGVQSEHSTFLGVRSTNPLPSSSKWVGETD